MHTLLGTTIDKTIQDIQSQGILPPSPCANYQGSMIFCAGALLVARFLEFSGAPESGSKFLRQLVTNPDSKNIVATGIAAGMDSQLVKRVVAYNDACAEHERASQVTQFLHSLKA